MLQKRAATAAFSSSSSSSQHGVGAAGARTARNSIPSDRRGVGSGSGSGSGVRVNAVILLAVPVLVVLFTASSILLIIQVWDSLPESPPPLFVNAPPVPGAAAGGDRPSVWGGEAADASLRGRIRARRSNASASEGGGSTSGESAEALLRRALSDASVVAPYDAVPRAMEKDGVYSVVHQLPSIPARRRMIPTLTTISGKEGGGGYFMPNDAVHNLTYFLESRGRPDEEDRPLYVYNPMVLPLDSRTVDCGALVKNVDCESDSAVKYVGVYRLSNFANCHGPGRGVPESYRNYLGLALLDGNLNIMSQHRRNDKRTGGGENAEAGGGRGAALQHLDIVIDLNQAMLDWGWMRTRGVKQVMQDCQLIPARSDVTKTGKKDRLFLLCNEYLMPVSLERTDDGHSSDREDVGRDVNDERNEFQEFTNKYGSGLRLSALDRPHSVLKEGKNLHFFEGAVGEKGGDGADHDRSLGPGFLEVWPGGPHEILPFNLSSKPFAFPRTKGVVMARASSEEPDPSFTTPNSQRGNSELIDRDSGSACCVNIRLDEPEQDLLLGFSHRKTRRGLGKSTMYNYVSRVYAFDPRPPFNIVARSGFFCLGFANRGKGGDGGREEAKESNNEQVWGATNDYKLQIHKEEFECPRIHFVTGIAEKVGDEDTVIISYGVNDCYPRMIEVPKEFLVGLLRPLPVPDKNR